jgi:sugar phosphate isomerase/epimerase
MRIRAAGSPHLTYCTNIHAGETWESVRENLRRFLPRVKARVSPRADMGVGLRLSAQAARTLCSDPLELQALRTWLDDEGLYVFTLNGFPHGAFHEVAVKTGVYRPDWLEDARSAYTRDLIAVLGVLLPEGLSGSISTVPVAFRSRITSKELARDAARRLASMAADLGELAEAGHQRIELAIEPEPACFLETTSEAVEFFENHLRSREVLDALCAERGVPRHRAAAWLEEHLGLCLDACHAAVEFEDPDETLDQVFAAGVRIGKIQVTAGLSLPTSDAAALAELAQFADEIYLHQVVVKEGDRLHRFLDLPEALAEAPRGPPWRVHFHVPVFEKALGAFESTQDYVGALLDRARTDLLSSHLEVETYTFGVLPPRYRGLAVEDAIARELTWTRGRLEGAPPEALETSEPSA